MVRNYVSNDIHLVQPTQYVVSKDRVANKPPPELELLPLFDPLLYTTRTNMASQMFQFL